MAGGVDDAAVAEVGRTTTAPTIATVNASNDRNARGRSLLGPPNLSRALVTLPLPIVNSFPSRRVVGELRGPVYSLMGLVGTAILRTKRDQ